MNEPIGQFNDKDFGFCRILFNKQTKLENVCLFASYTPSPFLPEYVYYYLDDIKKSNLSIIFISSSKVSDADLSKLSLISDLIIEKENKGADFGAWCSVLRYLDYGKSYQMLYLCNDSVFGPLISFAEIHRKFLSSPEDILGITDSYQGGYHIQSYFVGLKDSVLKSDNWETFWSSIKFESEKTQIIKYQEIGLSKSLFKSDLKYIIWANWVNKIDYKRILLKVSQSDVLRPRWLNRVLFERTEVINDVNPNSFLWKELIQECRSPFIKRELFIYPDLFEESEVESSWEIVLEKHSSYPVWLIKLFLIDHFFNSRLTNHLDPYAKTKLAVATAKVKNIKQPVANDGTEVPFFILDAIESLLPTSTDPLPDEHLQICQQLDQLQVKHSSIIFCTETKRFQSLFIYLTDAVVELSQFSLNRLKTILKRIGNPIIIVPDKGLSIIASSLLSLRNSTIILEKDFYSPVSSKRIAETFKNILSAYEEEERLNLFEKYSLADVTADALKGTNRSGFIGIEQTFDSRGTGPGGQLYLSGEEYQHYLAIKNKYLILYESTPLWYKKIGQIIKVFQGNKRLVIDFKDKGEKTEYRSTAADITHWYYHQYEVLPGWYKKIGKKLIKKQ